MLLTLAVAYPILVSSNPQKKCSIRPHFASTNFSNCCYLSITQFILVNKSQYDLFKFNQTFPI